MVIRKKKTKSKLNNTATKTDLVLVRTDLKSDIASVKKELKSDIASVKKELKSDIASVKKELKSDIASVRTELKLDIGDLKEELEAKIDYLPNKDEFYASQDKLMKELVAMREESVISTDTKRQVNNHEERLEVVEDRLGIQLAVSA